MKKTRLFKLSIISLILIIFFGTSIFIGFQVVKRTTKGTSKESTNDVDYSLLEKFDIDYDDFCDTYNIENFEVESTYFNCTLPADYIYCKDCNSKDHDTIILVSDINSNKYSNYPIAKFFLDKGYNVVTYDQRLSGDNPISYTSFGYYESFDLVDFVSYINSCITDKKLILYGTSFGANTVGIALDDKVVNNCVNYAILDSPINNINHYIESRLKEENAFLPSKYITFCANVINKCSLGFCYGEADVSTHSATTTVPTLIFNSSNDKISEEFMGFEIYNSISSDVKKEIYTCEDSEHGNIYIDCKDEYEQTILDFID